MKGSEYEELAMIFSLVFCYRKSDRPSGSSCSFSFLLIDKLINIQYY